VSKFHFREGKVWQSHGPGKLIEAINECCAAIAGRAVAARIDHQLIDLNTAVDGEHEVDVIVADDGDPAALEVLRHSSAHLMAQAVRELYGKDVQYTIGPALMDDFKYGFYYDFDLPESISSDDLEKIEAKMRELADRSETFSRFELPIDKAGEEFRQLGQRYKLELLDEIRHNNETETVSLYRQGDFLDLCRGPHLPHTGFIREFKLLSVAGAYWRGDAANKMLTRIYGVSFYDKAHLEQHLEKVAEAERRDHRALGKQLDLYSVSEDIGPGLILWHPNGAIIRQTIERFWIDEHTKRGYLPLYTPHIAHEKIYQRSGHLEAYSEMMYSPMDIDGQNYRIKPMNCPGHISVFNSRTRSYRDLPLRYCELGTVYRYEPSGTLHGMLRVRGFTQDDAHIFCTIEQLPDEIDRAIDLVDFMMKTFGYEYRIELATRPEKSIGTDEEWESSTRALGEVLGRKNLAYGVDEGGGVFYGPKIQMMLVDSLGREWQGPTIQVDLNLPRRFNCMYIGADNKEHLAVMVHRAVLGSMERFVGGLTEHYAGAFPAWLAPVQAMILPVSKKFNDYASAVYQRFFAGSIRAAMDLTNDKVGAKIRRATLQKVPYMLIVGAREQEAEQVSVRSRKAGDLGSQPLGAFIDQLSEEIRIRAL